MSQPREHNKTLPKSDEERPFSWGVKTGTINVYESFTLDNTEYSLYDTVYMRRDNDQVDIGKIIKILEMENQERKVEVVWFFKPVEIDCFLGDVKPLKNEVFLACGEGKGLSNLNSVEAILAKCNVVCSSKDHRNPQPSEKELGVADCIFHRTFDVGTQRVSEEFPSLIAGIKVDHFFNRRSCVTPSVGSEQKAQVRPTSGKDDGRFDVPGSTSSGGQMKNSIEYRPHAGRFDVPGSASSGGQIKSSIKDRHHAGSNIKKSVHFSSASPSDIGPGPSKKRKLLCSSGNRSDDALPYPPTKPSGEERHVKASSRENTDLSTGKNLFLKTSEFTGKRPVNKQHGTSSSDNYTEVTRRPGSGMDASKWLKLEVWNEASLKEAHDKGTLLVLENLDPSFAASEVEDIVWHVFKQKVQAKMLQGTAFSSPYFGQALVLFKTKEAADKVIEELYDGCLVLGDGRPIMVRRRFVQKMSAVDRFVGHLSIDRTRSQRQREELRNAVATSHFSQCNTVEFEMAMQWRELQEKSRRWWRSLREFQGKEIEALMKRMNTHCPSEK